MTLSQRSSNIRWTVSRFNQIDTQQLYALMQLRVDVFVVEQQCVYRELDGLDTLEDTLHIIGHKVEQANKVVAYARAMAPTSSRRAISIGRVLTSKDYRGAGVARDMMLQLMRACQETWPGQAMFLSAQVNVVRFYESLGYQAVSAEYLEDGIAHVDMLKQALA